MNLMKSDYLIPVLCEGEATLENNWVFVEIVTFVKVLEALYITGFVRFTYLHVHFDCQAPWPVLDKISYCTRLE